MHDAPQPRPDTLDPAMICCVQPLQAPTMLGVAVAPDPAMLQAPYQVEFSLLPPCVASYGQPASGCVLGSPVGRGARGIGVTIQLLSRPCRAHRPSCLSYHIVDRPHPPPRDEAVAAQGGLTGCGPDRDVQAPLPAAPPLLDVSTSRLERPRYEQHAAACDRERNLGGHIVET